jgi:hypothetical protein
LCLAVSSLNSGKAVTTSPACLLACYQDFGNRIMDEMGAGPCGWTSEHDDQVLLAKMGRC